MRTHLHTCTLCEAMCGVVVSVEGERVVAVRGDKDDPMSRGYLCAKGPASRQLLARPREDHGFTRSEGSGRLRPTVGPLSMSAIGTRLVAELSSERSS